MLKTNKNFQYYKTVDILGVRVDFIDLKKVLLEIEEWVKTNKKYQIVTPNPEQIVLAHKDYRFRRILNKANLRIADGAGLVWAARWLTKQSHGASLRLDMKLCSLFESRAKKRGRSSSTWRREAQYKFQRLAGVDLMLVLCKLAAQKSWPVFLLGGKDDVAKKVAENLSINRKSLIINHYGGTADIKNETLKEKEETIEIINKFKPHLLFVAYGAPEQEKWIYDNLPKLNAKVAMGVGGAFDYLAGKIQRAPFCIRSLGFEWFWRLVKQPWRARRQLALIKFVWLVLKSSRTISKNP